MDFMVDIETTGLNSASNGITELAAVPFNFTALMRGQLITRTPFVISNLRRFKSRVWDVDTLEWRKKHGHDLSETVDMPEALAALADYVAANSSAKPVFWAKPSHFDYPFVASHYAEAGLTCPWHRRDIRDVATFCTTVNPSFDMYSLDASPFNTHTGLGDCMLQLRTMLACVKSVSK